MSNAELIARLVALTEPDREVDRAILAWMGFSWRGMNYWHHDNKTMWPNAVPTYFTASLDDAIALTERLLPGWRWTIFGPHPDILTVKLAHAELWRRDPSVAITEPISGSSPTPAIALLIATLKAHDNLKEGNHG